MIFFTIVEAAREKTLTRDSLEKVRTSRKVFVVGNGMTRFLKPGKHSFDYHDLSKIAIQRALRDAGLQYERVEQAYCGYVNGDAASG